MQKEDDIPGSTLLPLYERPTPRCVKRRGMRWRSCIHSVLTCEKIILSPLESALDLIKERIIRFKAELSVGSHANVRINQLQQLLQGSVAPSKSHLLFLLFWSN